MQDLKSWLETHRLEKYLRAFADAEVEAGDLSELTEDDLKELGLPLGPRRRFLRAVRETLPETGSVPSPAHTSLRADDTRDGPERRQLTVMFADLAGSTTLSERLDPEELRAINRAFQDLAKLAIEAFDGFVARYMGDGVLAYFGYPNAHEDDAERSIRAGLRLVADLSKYEGPTPLRVRVGISTGPVVVGDLIGDAASQESAVVGETPNRAARLQSLAEPNTVIVSEVTRRLVGDAFQFRALSPTMLKGFSAPANPYQVLGETPGQSRFDARAHRGLSPFVGREEEMALLRARWDRVTSGRGTVALIVGEPGIGKSRLVEETRRTAIDEGAGMLSFQCSAYHRNTPFFPLITALEAMFAAEEPSPDGRLDAIRRAFGEHRSDTDLYSFLLANLLSIEYRGTEPPSLAALEPDARRRQTIAAAVELIAAKCRRAPILCVFEDLHWADPSSLEFLSQLVGHLAQLPILLLCTTRPGLSVAWSDLPQCRVIALPRLDGSDALDLASSISSLDAQTIGKVAARAGGNPLFLEELVYALAGAQSLRTADDIPATLHDSLMARLEATGPGRSVAQCAAVLGREFGEPELRAVWDAEADTLSSGIKAMIAAGLLFERSGADGRLEYTFKHALIRDAAYGTLLKDRRQALHRRAAKFLAELRATMPRLAPPDLIAEHFIEAGDPANALRYWLEAGEVASEASSYRECEAHMRQALTVIDHEEKGSFENQKLEALVLLGPALMTQYGYSVDEVGEVYVQARQISEALPAKPHLTPILNGLRLHNICAHGVPSGLEPANALLRHAEEIDDDASRIEGGKAVGSTLVWSAQFEAARQTLRTAISLYEQGENVDVMRIDSDSGSTCHSFLSLVEWATGNLDRSLSDSERAVQLAMASNRAFGIGEGLSFRAFLFALHRDNESAREVAAKAIELANEHDFILWKAMSSLARGMALVDQGQPQAGLRYLESSQRLMHDMGYTLWQGICLSQLARAQAALGELSEALSLAELAKSMDEANSVSFWLPETHRITATLYRLMGDADGTASALEEALRWARKTSNRMLELRATTDLAKDLVAADHHEEVTRVLKPIYEELARFSANADVVAAAGVLRAAT